MNWEKRVLISNIQIYWAILLDEYLNIFRIIHNNFLTVPDKNMMIQFDISYNSNKNSQLAVPSAICRNNLKLHRRDFSFMNFENPFYFCSLALQHTWRKKCMWTFLCIWRCFKLSILPLFMILMEFWWNSNPFWPKIGRVMVFSFQLYAGLFPCLET